MTDVEKIHAAGVRRHGAAWASANQRAVGALGGTPVRPWDPGIKEALPVVILRVLDGVRLDGGEEWLAENGRWTPRTERKNETA